MSKAPVKNSYQRRRLSKAILKTVAQINKNQGNELFIEIDALKKRDANNKRDEEKEFGNDCSKARRINSAKNSLSAV